MKARAKAVPEPLVTFLTSSWFWLSAVAAFLLCAWWWFRAQPIFFPLGELFDLKGVRQRILLVRFGTVAMISLALLTAALAMSRTEHSREMVIVEEDEGVDAVIVLDISGSMGTSNISLSAAIIEKIFSDSKDAKIGLVLFSDVGYEALPPSRTRLAFEKGFFDYIRDKNLASPRIPWMELSGGTYLKTGVAKAAEILLREKKDTPQYLIVISDLQDFDVSTAKKILAALPDYGIRPVIIGINTSEDYLSKFSEFNPVAVSHEEALEAIHVTIPGVPQRIISVAPSLGAGPNPWILGAACIILGALLCLETVLRRTRWTQ